MDRYWRNFALVRFPGRDDGALNTKIADAQNANILVFFLPLKAQGENSSKKQVDGK